MIFGLAELSVTQVVPCLSSGSVGIFVDASLDLNLKVHRPRKQEQVDGDVARHT